MFLNFRVKNFRSINETLELSMIPNDLKDKKNIIYRANLKATKNKDYYALTSAAIYGANASGKSNIVKALFEFRHFVLNSTDNKPKNTIRLYNPFKLKEENLDEPSCFSIDLLIENIQYTYSIEVLSNQVLKEDLVYYPKGIKLKIFEREKQNILKRKGYEGVFETIKQRTNENQLFLSKAASENVEFAKKIYAIIGDFLVFTTDIFHNQDFNKFVVDQLYNDEEILVHVLPLIKSFVRKIDTQVVDFIKNEEGIKTFHLDNLNNKIEFEFEEESSGTQRVFSLMFFLLTSLKFGSMVVVDEFERSLHPEIAQYILSLFNDLNVNVKGAQFIFATHDTTLLNPENKLRRDQINLVEKNKLGETEMYSLSDIRGIREGNYEKWYVEGRLGGVPNIARETFRDELIDFIKA